MTNCFSFGDYGFVLDSTLLNLFVRTMNREDLTAQYPDIMALPVEEFIKLSAANQLPLDFSEFDGIEEWLSKNNAEFYLFPNFCGESTLLAGNLSDNSQEIDEDLFIFINLNRQVDLFHAAYDSYAQIREEMVHRFRFVDGIEYYDWEGNLCNICGTYIC